MRGVLFALVCLSTLAACGLSTNSPAPSPIARGFSCVGWGVPSSDAVDVVIDLGQARQLTQTVDLRVGQVLDMGGGSCIPSWAFPATAQVQPNLEEVRRSHTGPFSGFAGGDSEIRYRAVRIGTLTFPLCAGTCIPRSLTVTVIPAEAPADAARAGTGTITLSGGPFAGSHPLSWFSCRQNVADGISRLSAPAGASFTFAAARRSYQGTVGPLAHSIGEKTVRAVREHDLTLDPSSPPGPYADGNNGPRYDIFEPAFAHPSLLARPEQAASSPRFGTITSGEFGGTLTTTPLYARDVHHDVGTVALEWHC
jgi:hypothetical protein